jgi:class 3 adenylate cyclase
MRRASGPSLRFLWAELPAGSKFCNKCGTPVATEARTQPRFASPESYTPKHLAEKILTSKAALEGERKQVTVLFADLKGSMELLADRDPEEARKLLDPVLERMMEAVHRYEGTVNQVMGDGIMALFGAPLAHEDHAIRACYAALRMQETIRAYSEEMRKGSGAVVAIRVGLNSGEVVVRSIGSDLRMDYTAVGQTTHVAARMEQIALPGSILLTAETLALAEGYVEVKPLGPVPVKGLAAPLDVYEVTRAATIRSRFQVAAARGLTRFVGRESELEQLRQALERARAGHGQVAAVVGEAGVGKSRLYWEFTHSHRAQGWLILESSSVSYGKATNYLPIIELLRAYFQIEHVDETRKIREKVMGKLLSLDRQLEPCVVPILWLLDVPIEDEKWRRLDPPQRRQRILDGVKRLLLRESQVQPLMVLFEDLHWIDAETQALLDNLVESLPTARLILLVNYRPEYGHGWGHKSYYRQIKIDPLPPESAETLLDALLGGEAALGPLKRLLIERTEGNPFFIEESVRSLVETSVLAGERGAYRLTGPSRASRFRPQPGRCWRRASIGSLWRTSACCRPPPLSAPMFPSSCSKPWPMSPRSGCAGGWPSFRRPNSSMRHGSFQTLSTPSGTRSRTRSRTAACSRTDGAPSMLGSWGPSNRSIPSVWPSTWNAWPIMPSAARCGTRPSPTSARPASERSNAPPTARPRPLSSRR